MKLSFKNERVLAVVAHPDDADLLCAGTLARAKHDGAAVGICVLCRGDKGQPAKTIRNLVAIRRKEMAASARLLGAQLYLAGFQDGMLQHDSVQRLKLTEIFRQFNPTLVLAHAPEDYHPDHQAAAALALAASWFCASRGQKTSSRPTTGSPELWHMDTVNMSGFALGFFVDISDYVETKAGMLSCHKTQLNRGRDTDFSPLMELMRLQAATRGSQSGVTAAEAFRIAYTFKRARAW